MGRSTASWHFDMRKKPEFRSTKSGSKAAGMDGALVMSEDYVFWSRPLMSELRSEARPIIPTYWEASVDGDPQPMEMDRTGEIEAS
ncbi:uncharacterized protein G2W53_030758 [Senna tora]|uniref:Uncharacterized protein n=1 Tax=Senna tora TaxID=362788 RepID=A0A834T718_9FABA|nr:uncharacterized protein G2W53_030758 [Senna tora]